MALTIALILVILGPANLTPSETSWEDWRFYAGTEFGSYHYNAEDIGYLPSNIVRIWQKLVLTNKGRANLTGELGREYENVSEIVVLREIDCMSGRSLILEVAYRCQRRRVLKSESYEQFDWDSITPDSVDDILRHTVCK
jgi:hypothetical protein